MSKMRKSKSAAIRTTSKSEVGQAYDVFTNAAARMGYGTPSVAENGDYTLVRLSNNYWLMITLYRNHWLSRRIVDSGPDDMVRAWPNLVSELEPGDIKDFDRTIDRTQTKQTLLKALKWGDLFGGAGALIVIKGHEKALEEPLNLDDVNPGSYRGLVPFDRWSGIYPDTEISRDAYDPINFGLPEFYRCQVAESSTSFRVHSSRVLRFCGPDVPRPELQAQMYWGISVLELVYEELRKKDNASWSILNLMFRANLIAQKNPELQAMLSGAGNGGQALTRFLRVMQAQNELLSNQSMLILGKDGELQSHQYSFSGISDIYQQFQMDVAGAARRPVTRLFGRTMTGLGQSNDGDERIYEETIAQEQDQKMRPQLNKLFPIVCMSEFGEVPDDLDFTFPSVRVLTEEDKAELATKGLTAISAAFAAQVFTHRQALLEVKQMSLVTGFGTSITDIDIKKADNTPPPAPMSMGELGGDQPEDEKKAGAKDSYPEVQHRMFAGFPVAIENPVGSTRSGEGWSVTMTYPYGYIHSTEGADGDEVDCFLGPNEGAANVYVVHTKKDGIYDEDKLFVGFDSQSAALEAFFENYHGTNVRAMLQSVDAVPTKELWSKMTEFRGRKLRGELSVA